MHGWTVRIRSCTRRDVQQIISRPGSQKIHDEWRFLRRLFFLPVCIFYCQPTWYRFHSFKVNSTSVTNVQARRSVLSKSRLKHSPRSWRSELCQARLKQTLCVENVNAPLVSNAGNVQKTLTPGLFESRRATIVRHAKEITNRKDVRSVESWKAWRAIRRACVKQWRNFTIYTTVTTGVPSVLKPNKNRTSHRWIG